jgi:hypothetical protein
MKKWNLCDVHISKNFIVLYILKGGALAPRLEFVEQPNFLRLYEGFANFTKRL